MDDLSTLDTPRLVKKPGGLYLRVENQDELKAALADGWQVRLAPPSAPVAAPEPDDSDDEHPDVFDVGSPKKGGKKK